jgi:hypothetical protein
MKGCSAFRCTLRIDPPTLSVKLLVLRVPLRQADTELAALPIGYGVPCVFGILPARLICFMIPCFILLYI